jgi:hypothetical protein
MNAHAPAMLKEAAAEASLAHIATLWIGEALGPVERACLKSVIRQGHSLSLYCYRRPEGVPAGIEIRDAAEILPEDRIIRHESGSVALFANWFRYELQRRGLGTWVDCDVYLVAPLESALPYLFGEQGPGSINVGVFRAPPDSPLLPPLLALFEERRVPHWLPWRPKLSAYARLLTSGRSGLSKMPWGSAGPRAASALAKELGLFRLAAPRDVLYPVHWRDAEWIRDPALSLDDMITPRTLCVHIWNQQIKHFKDRPAPPGSFLARLQAEGAD